MTRTIESPLLNVIAPYHPGATEAAGAIAEMRSLADTSTDPWESALIAEMADRLAVDATRFVLWRVSTFVAEGVDVDQYTQWVWADSFEGATLVARHRQPGCTVVSVYAATSFDKQQGHGLVVNDALGYAPDVHRKDAIVVLGSRNRYVLAPGQDRIQVADRLVRMAHRIRTEADNPRESFERTAEQELDTSWGGSDYRFVGDELASVSRYAVTAPIHDLDLIDSVDAIRPVIPLTVFEAQWGAEARALADRSSDPAAARVLTVMANRYDVDPSRFALYDVSSIRDDGLGAEQCIYRTWADSPEGAALYVRHARPDCTITWVFLDHHRDTSTSLGHDINTRITTTGRVSRKDAVIVLGSRNLYVLAPGQDRTRIADRLLRMARGIRTEADQPAVLPVHDLEEAW